MICAANAAILPVKVINTVASVETSFNSVLLYFQGGMVFQMPPYILFSVNRLKG